MIVFKFENSDVSRWTVWTSCTRSGRLALLSSGNGFFGKDKINVSLLKSEGRLWMRYYNISKI